MKHFIATFLIALFALSGSAHAQSAAQDIKKAEDYLRGLTTVKAEFIQIADNGARLGGMFYLDRPGKLRFEYNDLDDFIVADGIFIYFYDGELKEQTNAPIGQTLADFLLRADLSLKGDLTVQNIAREDGFVVLTLSETDDPGVGSLRLFFSENPYALKKWQVTDAAGLTTEIILRDMQRDIDLPASLFAYFNPDQDKKTFNE